jgi:hypothetical protein
MAAKLKGVLKGLQRFKDSVKDLPASDFKYKSSRSKKTNKDSSSNDVLSKFLSRIDKDPALRERIKSANRKKDKAKEAEKKDKRKAMALAGATGATLAGGFMLGAEREKARLKKEKERMKKIQKKKAGGLVTRWESKWG